MVISIMWQGYVIFGQLSDYKRLKSGRFYCNQNE
jgi:hypothetical protein